MAFGKWLARFWDQWSVMGICMYLYLPASSKTLGKSGVTFKMYWKQKKAHCTLQKRIELPTEPYRISEFQNNIKLLCAFEFLTYS